MKGNKKILTIAILVLLITVSFTTYAIYKTSLSGEAQVTAAIWNVTFEDGADTLTAGYTVTLGASDCTSAHVTPGKIAPGASCTKDIVLNINNTEVDVEYAVEVGDATVGTATVYETGANEFAATLSPATGSVLYNAANRQKTLTLTVTWDDEDDSAAATPNVINDADTALQGQQITIPLTLVAKQKLS